METINIYNAETRFSQLVDKAAAAEDVVVSRNGKPLVRTTRLDEPRGPFGNNLHIWLATCGRAAALQMLAVPGGIAVLCALHRIPQLAAKCTTCPRTGPKRRIKFGVMKGQLVLAADFDAALPDGVSAGFEGR